MTLPPRTERTSPFCPRVDVGDPLAAAVSCPNPAIAYWDAGIGTENLRTREYHAFYRRDAGDPALTDCRSALGQPAQAPLGASSETDAQWIWSPAYEKDTAPQGDCYFRKAFNAGKQTAAAVIHISADNQYELRVNGQRVGQGGDWRKMDTFDITRQIQPGKT